MAGAILLFTLQLVLPIMLAAVGLWSRGPQLPPSEGPGISFSVRPPTSVHGDSQSGRLSGFPTEETARQFCADFQGLVEREGWTLERCSVIPTAPASDHNVGESDG